MKNILLLLFAFSVTPVYAQHFSGKLEHVVDKSSSIRYSQNGITNSEKTILPNENGEFSIRIQLQNPVIAHVFLTGEIGQDIFLAPGLTLTMKADVAGKKEFNSTLQFSGTAGRYNRYFGILRFDRYLQHLDSSKNTSGFYQLPLAEKLELLKKYKSAKDSIRNRFFQTFKGDQLAIKFKMADSIETQAVILITVRNIYNRETSKEEKRKLWDNHIMPFMTETDDPVILSGYNYKFMWLAYSHTTYFLGKEKGDTLWYTSKNELERYCNNTDRIIQSKKLIEAMYATYHLRSLGAKYKEADEKDFPELDSVFERMLTRILSQKLSEELRILNTESRELARINRKGKPAVAFQLVDTSGKVYRLTDFSNKVLVLDLWASWCGPCIAEFPYMRKLLEKFKGIDKIQFVAVSVDKYKTDWIEKGIRKYSPPGLQLWLVDGDRDSEFYKNYGGNGIPHYIIIDKKGNYHIYEAPYPSDGDKLEKLILDAIR